MRAIWRIKFQTTIHFFYILVVMLSLVYATAWADVDCTGFKTSVNTAKSKLDSNKDLNLIEKIKLEVADAQKALDECNLLALRGKEDERKSCDAKEKDINTSIQKLKETCGSYTKATSEGTAEDKACYNRFKACLRPATSNSDSVAQFASIFGVSRSGNSKENCTLTPGDFRQSKRDTESELKTLGKDVREVEKEAETIQKDYNTAVRKLQESLIKEQEEFEKRQAEMEENEQAQEEAALKADRSAANQLADLGFKRMELRNKIAQARDEVQGQLIVSGIGITHSECLQQVKEYKAKIAGPGAGRTSHAEQLISMGSKLKGMLQARFNACMEVQDLKRKTLADNFTRTVQTIAAQLDEVERQIGEIENEMRQSGNKREERAMKLTEKKDKDLKMAQQKTAALQAELTDENKTLQSRMQTSNRRLSELKQEQNMKNSELVALGSQPTTGKSDKSVKNLVDDYNLHLSQVQQFVDDQSCCPEGSTATSYRRPACAASKKAKAQGGLNTRRGSN